ncbi:MAG: hypothetical protein QJR00_00165 [Bacillota bacterium]|nr:hypothetical protein [Bacillota bacterium]
MRSPQLLALVLALAFLLGATAGILWDQLWQPPYLAKESPAVPVDQPEAARIQRDTEIVRRITYVEGTCRQTLEDVARAPADWVGWTRADLEEFQADAIIEEFSPQRVVIHRQAPGCPYRGRTLLLRQGRVGVYYGTPNDLGPLMRETEITEEVLRPQDRARLEEGVTVLDDEEVEKLLEGLKD